MRDVQEDAMPDTAYVRSRTQAADGIGGYTDSWANGSAIACRVAPYSSRQGTDEVMAERIGARTAWTVTLPAATVVTTDNRLVVGSRTFEVVGVLAAHSWETARRVVCVEVV